VVCALQHLGFTFFEFYGTNFTVQYSYSQQQFPGAFSFSPAARYSIIE
jgi:hypothetical protein